MSRSHVTLPQILAAASTRHASMVPESAGYLMLALCEAIGCLPISIADTAIQLSADGSVSVSEKGGVLPAPEAARAMRDLFERLLAVTTGPTPRLAAVARSRDLSMERGLDALATEVEAALVPMNRAAGKRSLGRLARETLRAIESGALALHLQARAAVKEAPATTATIAPLLAAPPPAPAPTFIHPPLTMITPPPSMMKQTPEAVSFPYWDPGPPTTPGLGLDTVATEAPIDSGIFGGATPTFQEGQDISVVDQNLTNEAVTFESPGFDSATTAAVSCDPTKLSARDVKIESATRTPSSELTTKIVSTNRRSRRTEPVRAPTEITLTSAGVEPRDDVANYTPAPSVPEGADAAPMAQPPNQLAIALPDFTDCHDGNTQSQPNLNETLPGLAPVVLQALRSEDAGEPLRSGEYVLCTPSALPRTNLAEVPGEPAVTSASIEELQDMVLSARLLHTAPPEMVQDAPAMVQNASDMVHGASPLEGAGQTSNAEFVKLENPSDPPGRVDELLGTFGRPEEGEEEMLKRTASSLKELAGIEATPYAPEISPGIRVPVMKKKASPAWLPEDSRNIAPLDPAPLVRASRGLRAGLAIPLALLLALFAGFAVVHFRLPEVLQRWVNPPAAKQSNPVPAHAAADENDVYEQR